MSYPAKADFGVFVLAYPLPSLPQDEDWNLFIAPAFSRAAGIFAHHVALWHGREKNRDLAREVRRLLVERPFYDVYSRKPLTADASDVLCADNLLFRLRDGAQDLSAQPAPDLETGQDILLWPYHQIVLPPDPEHRQAGFLPTEKGGRLVFHFATKSLQVVGENGCKDLEEALRHGGGNSSLHAQVRRGAHDLAELGEEIAKRYGKGGVLAREKIDLNGKRRTSRPLAQGQPTPPSKSKKRRRSTAPAPEGDAAA